MSLSTDIRVRETTLYFLPVPMRMPLKFGAQVVTQATCARVKVRVEDANGRSAEGWGETPERATGAQTPSATAPRRGDGHDARRGETPRDPPGAQTPSATTPRRPHPVPPKKQAEEPSPLGLRHRRFVSAPLTRQHAQRARDTEKSGTIRASSASLRSAWALATKRVQPASNAKRAASRRTRAARWPLSAR